MPDITRIIDGVFTSNTQLSIEVWETILGQYKDFINDIDKLSKHTPIVHYCYRAGTNAKLEIIKAFISKSANPDLRNLDNVALKYFVKKEIDVDHHILSIVKFLIPHTSTESLMNVYDQSGQEKKTLLELIITNKRYWDSVVALPLLLSICTSDSLNHDQLSQYWQYIESSLLEINDFDIAHTIIKLYLNYRNEEELSDLFEVLLDKAIKANNIIVIGLLIEYGVEIHEQKFLSTIAIDQKDISEIAKLISSSHKLEANIWKTNNIFKNIIVCGEVIDLYSVYKTGLSEKMKRLARDVTNLDKESLGFQNNVFHVLALDVSVDEQTLEEVYISLQKNKKLLINNNDFSQSALSIAIYMNNKRFLSFFKKHFPDYSMQNIDADRNNCVHVIARSYLVEIEMLDIMDLLNISEDLVNEKNKLGYTPVNIAVQNGNCDFLKWAKDHNFITKTVDLQDNTLWHDVASSSINRNIVQTCEILGSSISDIINSKNKDGFTPILLAIQSVHPEVLRYFLEKFPKECDLLTADNHGNTIAHVLTSSIIKDITNYAGIDIYRLKEIVELLIPYRESIKELYSQHNQDNKRPIDFIIAGFSDHFAIYLHRLVNKAIKLLNLQYEDDFIFKAQGLIDEVLRTDITDPKLASAENGGELQYILTIIKALSFNIAYDKVNSYEDTVIHELLNLDILEFSTSITAVYVFNIIDQRLVKDIYRTYNTLGLAPIHLSMDVLKSSEMNYIIFQYGILVIGPNLIEQKTKPTAILEANNLNHFSLDLIEYVIFSNPDIKVSAQVSKFIAFSVEAYKIPIERHKSHLADQSHDHHIRIYRNLLNDRKHLIKEKGHYFPMSDQSVQLLLSRTKVIDFKEQFHIANDLKELKEIVEEFIIDTQIKIKLILFLHLGHGTSITLFRQSHSACAGFLQDSNQGLELFYHVNILKIKSTLLSVEHMTSAYELQTPQQGIYDANCVIWSLAGLNVIFKFLSNTDNSGKSFDHLQKDLSSALLKETTPMLQSIENEILEMRHSMLLSYVIERDLIYHINEVNKGLKNIAEKISNVNLDHTHDHQEAGPSGIKANIETRSREQAGNSGQSNSGYETPIKIFALSLPFSLEQLEQQETKIGLKNAYCVIDPSMRRAKRSICEEDTQKIQHEPFEHHLLPGVQNDSQLYITVAYLYTLQNSDTNTHNIQKLLQYISNIGKIIHIEEQDRSIRENQILNQYYTDAKSFASQYKTNSFVLFKEDESEIDVPVLFSNGQHSLIVYRENEHYQIYSPQYNYRMAFQTNKDISFDDIKEFARAFFTFMSAGSKTSYQVFTLSQSLPQEMITHLTPQSKFDNPDQVMPDLEALKLELLTQIDGISSQCIRELFLLDGRVPEIHRINQKFFKQNPSHISWRVEKLHKVLQSLSYQESKNLVDLIHKYEFATDTQYINTLAEEEERKIFESYCNKVTAYLNKHRAITKEILSALSLEVLGEHISKHLSDLVENHEHRSHSIVNFIKTTHTGIVSKLGGVVKNVGINSMFFIPDVIRSFNNGDTSQLKQMVGMASGDAAINSLFAKLAKLHPKYLQCINKLPISSPIFKIITLYSIAELNIEASQLPPGSVRKQIIQHHLSEEYATVGIIALELFASGVAEPLFGALFIEQLIYSGKEINIENDLNIATLESIWMSLGFEQNKFNTLITEEHLLKNNLAHIASLTPQYHSILYLIRIPKINGNKKWEDIHKDQVPEEIRDELWFRHDNRINLQRENNTRIVEYNDLRLIDSCYPIKHSEIPAEACGMASLQQAYYDAYPLALNVTLEYTQKMKYIVNIMRMVTPPTMPCDLYATHEFFIEKIEYLNITWNRVPQEVFLPVSKCNLDYVDSVQYTAIYSATNAPSNLSYLLYFHFDPHEGDLQVIITKEQLKLIQQQYSNKVILIHVADKTYDTKLKFTDTSSISKFRIDDASGTLKTHYIIGGSTTYNQLEDNTKSSEITCTGNNTVHGIPTDTRISGTTITFTQKSNISLDLQDCYIGEALIMTAGNISINGVLGKSKQSKIILDNVSTMFDMTLRGDISIYHGHTYFKMYGIFLDKNYLNPQYSNILTRNNVIEYHITLTNLIQVLGTCNISHTKEDINVIFTHSMVDYSWRTNKNVSDTLHIYDKDSQTYIKIASDVDIMNLDTGHDIIQQQSYHHNHETILEQGLILKNVYYNDASINYNAQEEFQGVIETLYNLTMPMMRLTTLSKDSLVLLFTDNNANDFYHIFPPNRNIISINNVHYQITKNKICAILEKTDYIEQGFKYFSSVDDKEKEIGICVNTILSVSNVSGCSNTTVIINGITIKDIATDTYVYFLDKKLYFDELIKHCIADIEHNQHPHHHGEAHNIENDNITPVLENETTVVSNVCDS